MGRDANIRRLFREYGIELVFESAQFFGSRLGIPAVAWIPDFQHKAFPEMFSRAAWWKREIGFRMQVAAGRTIMLSSEDARKACEHYYPETRGRTRTVHFAVAPASSVSFAEARRIADLYGLPESFFFIPNQFWRHKNHLLVLDALMILRERGKQVVVVSSGVQTDPRDPNYFPMFKKKLEENKMEYLFRLSGVIPYPHVVSLMRVCTAMVNPSLFEGWSTTVEEARAMGTPMVLSDIDVHREQMGDLATYFDRKSPRSLANVLDGFITLTEDQREKMADVARDAALHRVEKFAEDFTSLVERCCMQS
jgi:glycosyltransferase involved in cell wall biosynthesis